MNELSQLPAVIIATVVLQSLLYGIFLLCFFANLYLRTSKYAIPGQFASRSRPWRNPVIISTVALFLTCSAHWVLSVVRFSRGVLSGSIPTEAALLYADNSQKMQVVRSALAEATVLIGDAVIIHRLWLTWNRNLNVVVVPVISWFGVVACTVAVAHLFSRSSVEHNLFYTPAGGWVTANYVLTMIINVYCTAFIAWQIWRTTRAMKDMGEGLLMPVLAILVESAAIWSAWAIFFAVAFQRRSVLEFLAKDLTPVIVALTNMFIHLRVGFGWSRTQETRRSGVQMTSSASMFRITVDPADSYNLESVGTSPPSSSK
ncbi:hypothetical protein B0H13DRAFT_1128928 [Mycena leptocephala]|nr:hypothetical protein B0H13DRAFT_1128928 [Mycena leptocephala]